MSSQRGARIIACSLAAIQLHITYAQLYEQVYRFGAPWFESEDDLWCDYAGQHTWLFDTAGVENIQITAISTLSLDLKITASLRSHHRIHTLCMTRRCNKRSSFKTLASTNPIESDSAGKIVNPPVIHKVGGDSKEKKMVCLVQFSNFDEENCRRCLIRRSESRLGDFFVTMFDDELVAHVMYTSSSRLEIAEACLAIEVCQGLHSKGEKFDDGCSVIHGTQHLSYDNTMTPGVNFENLPMNSKAAPFLKCMEVKIKPGKKSFDGTYKMWFPVRMQIISNLNIVLDEDRYGAG